MNSTLRSRSTLYFLIWKHVFDNRYLFFPTEKLPEKVTKIRTLIIRVALSQDNYPNQEQMLVDIAYVMNRMKQFKEYCSQLKQKSQREVTWAWYRVGVLSEIGNLGFNNFDPDEE